MASEWRASASETLGQRSSASRSRRCCWSGLDGEIDQERQVLLGAESDQLARRREQRRLSQAAQVAAWGHRLSMEGVVESMQSRQLGVNTKSTSRVGLTSRPV